MLMSLCYSLALFHSSLSPLPESPDSFLPIISKEEEETLTQIFFHGGEKKFLFFGWSEENEKKMKTNEKTPSRRGRERERETFHFND
jgi:hypothetical protein